MQELDTPLRLTWSLPGEASLLRNEQLLKIAREIADAGVMFVTLEGDPLRHPAIFELLQLLQRQGGQVSLVVPDDHRLEPDLPLRSLALNVAAWFREQRLDEDRLQDCLQRIRSRGYEPLFWLAVMKRHLSEIPELLRFCARCGVGKIKLSNLPIDASFGRIGVDDVPRPAELSQVAVALRQAAADIKGQVALEIHDRFLWELLSDEESSLSEYGGCQAANSIAHVDAQGTVHPCSSWLQPLGSLLTTELDEIWASDARHAVLDSIAAVPEGCVGCREYKECFAGCRGLSACFDFTNQGRDPLCAERR